MEPVAFLDRDGTINEEVNYLYKPEDLKLLSGAAEAIRLLNENGYKTVVITNQAGVARGYYTEADVVKLHEYLNEELGRFGAHIDYFFYCPHHPQYGIGKYKVNCHCRKPRTGLFEQAEQFISVDKARSCMIGDKLIDVEAGHNYGVKGILVGSGYGKVIYEEWKHKPEKERPFDAYGETLLEAVQGLLKGFD